MYKPRKIIFECKVGSKLYGTDNPNSDDDIMGVFINSTDEIFELQNPSSEWTMDIKLSNSERNIAGDIDKKYYSVKKFLQLAGEGQSKQLEMLFTPEDKITIKTPEWNLITKDISIFLSKSSISPSIGFAKAQAYRAVIKGDNLNLLKDIINKLELVENKNQPLYQFISKDLILSSKLASTTDLGLPCFEIVGRKFEYTCSVKNTLKTLKELESKYGTRSKDASENGYDWKSLSHTYRLLFQIKELKTTGRMTFPLPKDQIEFIKNIREGKYKADYFEEIQRKIKEIDELESVLPEEVNWNKINTLCKEILYNYYY